MPMSHGVNKKAFTIVSPPDFIHCNHFYDAMKFNIDMFCSTMMLGVLCHCNR